MSHVHCIVLYCVVCAQALGYIGAVFGGPIAGLIADRMGRKLALMLVSIPYLIGYMMITYARFASDPVVFKTVLLIGRLFSGVGLGWSSLAVVVSAPFVCVCVCSSRGGTTYVVPTSVPIKTFQRSLLPPGHKDGNKSYSSLIGTCVCRTSSSL